MSTNDINEAERAAFEKLFADIHPAAPTNPRMFERIVDDSRYCSLEVEYAWRTYRAALSSTPSNLTEGEISLPPLPKQPEELRARWKCEDCDGKGYTGEMIGGDYYNPPEPCKCSSCDGAGCVETAAVLPEQAAGHGLACYAIGRAAAVRDYISPPGAATKAAAPADALQEFAGKLAAAQAPLDADIAKILHENLDQLYSDERSPAEDAREQQDDADNLSVMLWLLRRLPRAYGNPPNVIGPIRKLAARTGTDIADCLAERAGSEKAQAGEDA